VACQDGGVHETRDGRPAEAVAYVSLGVARAGRTTAASATGLVTSTMQGGERA
jgi:hypothetical protein